MSYSQATARQPKHYTWEQIETARRQPVPQHIAIVPDGNRRWAAQASQDPNNGHRQGSRSVIHLVEAAGELGIKTVTLYAFSTENWSRTQAEVDFLMDLLEANILQYTEQLVINGARLETIGDLSALSPRLQQLLADAKERSKGGDTLTLVLAINYGSRDEMCRAIRRLVVDSEEGKIAKEAIDEQVVSRYLDTAQFGDPDLFIRTSGEMRISNFLLWQLCYTELVFSKVLWPDFAPHHLLEAVCEFQNRKRRFGA